MDSESKLKDKKEEISPKKELPGLLQKICLVCGDKALGYNFNAIACESCKAFFRRNALSSKDFKCPFANNCEITIVTRRFCQKCRLEKCLSVGMVKEFIMSDEDKAQKRRKIEENRAKKRQHTEPDTAVTSTKISRKDEEISSSSLQQEPILQYDVLNSTTCSPNSTVQSPLSNDQESLSSSSVYHQYVPLNNTEHPYHMKVYPIDDKSIYDKNLYEQRVMDSFNICDNNISVDSNIYGDSVKKSSIRRISHDDGCRTDARRTLPALTRLNVRSLLINESTNPTFQESKQQHVCEELPAAGTNPDVNKARDILQDVERIEPNSMESILCEAIKLEFEAYSSVNSCSGSSRELNEVERAKLNELIVANKALHAPIDDDVSMLIGENTELPSKSDGKHDPRLITIVNLTAVAIRRFIKMAKKINAFKNMCEEDQVALLKGGCIEMLILRSTMTYDGQENQWKLPVGSQEQFGSIRTDVLKLAKGNIYRSHESFIRSFDQRWRMDENIILIMSAILMFTPDRPKVVHRDVIKLEQNSYYYLLRRYLESVYPGCEAKSTFLKLIQKILELRKLAEEVTGVYLDVNPIEPLLMEIFDLKHHAA